MARREFPQKVKSAVIKRAGSTGMLLCERCGGFARRFQIDHVIADAHGGEPTIENAMLICEDCYREKNAADTTIAAKLKRVEAKHLGARKPSKWRRTERERPSARPSKAMERRPAYIDIGDV